MKARYDVVVVGAGNAAFSAAHAAMEHVGRVLVLEKAPREWAGGNSYFTAGAIRTTYDGLDDLRPIVQNLTDGQAATTELPPYTPDEFMSDMERVTEGRCDKELTRILVDDAADTTLRIDKSVSSLVQAGPFRYSRNPGYLSLTMLYAGTAILRNALWAILLLPLVLYVIQREVIEREERYLERIFGEEYLAYKRRVRRWV